jgi:site-specific DNA-methyltransferase (adenine-specific)
MNILSENHRPDILTCLANLSSDEVFTAPVIANKMLDLLPKEVWTNPDLTWLDPGCKSGVILREIAARLMESLKTIIPNEDERRNHILRKMLWGIPITEITGMVGRRTLYCSKDASGEFSNYKADTSDGNIRWEETDHTFKNGRCTFCGAPEDGKDEEVEEEPNETGLEPTPTREFHAYQFIHQKPLPEKFPMKIDIIITNPPYQLKDGGHGASAKPIYHLFVKQAKKMARHVVMIIPARWYAGGKGLDDFRQEMMDDKSLKTIVDIPNSNDAFPGVAIAGGVCYFHRDSEYQGECDFQGTKRNLGEFDVIIRNEKAVSILKKVMDKQTLTGGGGWFSETVSPRKPFGLPTNFPQLHWFSETVKSLKPFGLRTNFKNFSKELNMEDYNCRTKDGMKPVKKTEVTQGHDLIPKWKSICSRADGAASQPDKDGRQRVLSISNTLAPNSVCLETYLVTGTYNTETEAENAASYLLLKLPRFLLSLRKIDQNLSNEKFKWVPRVDFKKSWTDKEVYQHFGLSEEEIEIVEGTIK